MEYLFCSSYAWTWGFGVLGFWGFGVPTYTGSGWYGYTYKTHLNGCQHWYGNIEAPKKLLLAGPAHLERPYHTFHSEVLRWHDHWLKGIDTGIMNDRRCGTG